MGLDKIGRDSQSLAQRLGGPVELTQTQERLALIGQCGGEIWPQFECLPETGEGVVGQPQAEQGVAQVVVRIHAPRLQAQRFPVAFHGGGELPDELSGDPQVEMDLGVIRIEAGCAPKQLHGRLTAAALVRHDPEQVDRIGPRWLALQGLPAEFLRLPQPSGPVVLQGRSHRIRWRLPAFLCFCVGHGLPASSSRTFGCDRTGASAGSLVIRLCSGKLRS